jgi:hypothetical protein
LIITKSKNNALLQETNLQKHLEATKNLKNYLYKVMRISTQELKQNSVNDRDPQPLGKPILPKTDRENFEKSKT